jgi:hypothetical protein
MRRKKKLNQLKKKKMTELQRLKKEIQKNQLETKKL